MPLPRSLPLIVSGLVFTTLCIALPMLHLHLRPTGGALLLLLIPPAVLVVMLLAPRLSALSHFAFPLAHLPILLAYPELTGPRVYGGATGLVAFLAVVAAGAAYLVATTPRLVASRARPEWLVVIGTLLALAPSIALTAPALVADTAPWASLTCLALAPLIAWWLVARGFLQHVALPAVDPATRTRAFYTLRERIRPRPATFVLAALASALTLGLLAFWYLWSPR